MEPTDVQHDPEGRRFFLRTENGLAYLDYERVNGNKLDYKSTFVPAEDRHRGIAGRIVERAFEYASDHDLLVIPSCSYVRDWVEKNPRVAGMVAEG